MSRRWLARIHSDPAQEDRRIRRGSYLQTAGGRWMALVIVLAALAIWLGGSTSAPAQVEDEEPAAEVAVLDLPRLEFAATVQENRGDGSVLLLTSAGRSVLVPDTLSFLAHTVEGVQAVEVGREEDAEAQAEPQVDPGSSVVPVDEAMSAAAGIPARVRAGDRVTVVVPAGAATVAALQNDVLTLLRAGEALQIPLGALPEPTAEAASVLVRTCVGEEPTTVSLLEASRLQGEGAVVLGDVRDAVPWSTDMAERAVIAAAEPDRLLLVAAVDGTPRVVSATPVFQAGTAVAARGGPENLVLEPFTGHDETRLVLDGFSLEGQLTHRTDGALVLRTDEGHSLLLPDLLTVRPQDAEVGGQVSVSIPPGSAEVVAVQEGVATMRTRHGTLQVPIQALPAMAARPILREGFRTSSRDAVLEWNAGMEADGVVVADEGQRVLMATALEGSTEVVAIPKSELAAGQVLIPGSTVSVASEDGAIQVAGWTDSRAGVTTATSANGTDTAVNAEGGTELR